jgi:hypothetical protein
VLYDERGTCLHMVCRNSIQISSAQAKEDTTQDTAVQEYVLRAAGYGRACLRVKPSEKPVYSIA